MSKGLGSFDPGVNVPKRWNVAFTSAIAAMDVDPFVLEIDGAFVFEEQVVLTRQMVIRGGGPGVSKLSWSTASAGMRVSPAAGYTRLSGLHLASPIAWLAGLTGLSVNAPRCVVDDLLLDDWGRHGLAVVGDTNVQSNANAGRYGGIIARLCGHGGAPDGNADPLGAGVYFAGGDANANTLTGMAFDCRKGFVDSSFLGNVFVGCLAEACGDQFDKDVVNGVRPRTGTGYATTDPNCRATFIGCYAEADSPGRVQAPAMIYGGMFDNIGTALALGPDGVRGSFPTQNFIDPKNVAKVALGGGQPGEALSLFVYDATSGATNSEKHALQFGTSAPGWWAMNYANGTRVDAFRFRQDQTWFPSGVFLGNNGGARGLRLHVVPSLQVALDNPGLWANGDRILIAEPNAGEPCSYVLTATGWAVCSRVEATP